MNFLKKIFSPTCLIVSLSLLFYTFYKSEIRFGGLRNDFYITYYIISTLLVLGSIISFFISKKIKEYLIISGLSLIISFYILEKYLIHNNLDRKELILKKNLYKKETGKQYDTRTRIEVYKNFKKLNNKITLTVSPQNYFDADYKIFPLSGISNSDTIYGNENGYYSIYKSDRYGFNNPDGEWDSEEIEYLLVGDSFTHGACVNRPDDISSVLRKLSDKSVLNLGYGGNGPLIEYATLREYLKPNVKKVLWIYFEGNDLGDLNREIENKILKNYLTNLKFTQNLRAKQKKIDNLTRNTIEKDYIKSFRFIKLTEVRKKIKNLLAQKKINITDENEIIVRNNKIKEILKLAKDLTIKNNSKLYFIYLPNYYRYKNKQDNSNYSLIKNIVTELEIPFIDVDSEVFQNEQNPLKLFPFSLNGHYNVEGYRKISKIIYKFTKD